MKAGSLTVVGTGIRLVSQATLEAISYMKQAEKLLSPDRWHNPARWSSASSPACGMERRSVRPSMVIPGFSFTRRMQRSGRPGAKATPPG